jgi:hypothetical protein
MIGPRQRMLESTSETTLRTLNYMGRSACGMTQTPKMRAGINPADQVLSRVFILVSRIVIFVFASRIGFAFTAIVEDHCGSNKPRRVVPLGWFLTDG